MKRFKLAKTIAVDPTLSSVAIDNYSFHVRVFGVPSSPPVIVVHGGPGADLNYLLPMRQLAKNFFVIFYDQRGTGLSPRVARAELTLEQNLQDLQALVRHFGRGRPVRLIGHSWGAMLSICLLGRAPELIESAVAVEPGMLTPDTAVEFVRQFKAMQRLSDVLPLGAYMLESLLVPVHDGQERLDYVMTRMLNRNKPGGPYQCEGVAMPNDAFLRGGYAAFKAMLNPIFSDPRKFCWNMTENIDRFHGRLLMLSSECSFIGFDYQQQFHLPLLPPATIHRRAEKMGHNMLTLNADWACGVIEEFFQGKS
ncbi:alpha/beta hydrolase [uncultured Herbaspirillum sp.]|uniref:alpha/beta fold hydrolase n=1 Tax=uncultured Herbaspirillum sp. TaxID=160236 RepID=UPI002587B646|nr:alpha/beta hydrolase [uncultured Herbaspirillum sp.]